MPSARQPNPVVLIAIENKDIGKYLLIKRRNPPYKGYWGLVGGKWEFGESVFEAGRREALEETGLSLEKVELRGIVSEYLFGNDNTLIEHFLIFVLYSVTREQSLLSSEEGIVKWFSVDELQKISMIPTDKLMLDNLILKVRKNVMPYIEAVMKTVQEKPKLIYFKKKVVT
ncbi:MAG: NUDIX hydrolase [Candidatus Asgardarchaeia archaeon]